jgi:hypothetical protein
MIRRLEFQVGVAVGAILALALFCGPVALVLALGPGVPASPHHSAAQADD